MGREYRILWNGFEIPTLLEDGICNLLGFAESTRILDVTPCKRTKWPYMSLLWKPVHVPSTEAPDVSDDEFKAIEIQGRHGIKPHIKQYQCPLIEGIYCIGYSMSAIHVRMLFSTVLYLQGLCGPCAG